MSVLDRARETLINKHEGLCYTEANGRILVDAPAPAGFAVSISEDLIVGYDGWHEHFDTPEKALQWFAFGFSDKCRLKVAYRGMFAYRWTMESLREGQWVEHSTTALLLFPFWRAERIEYRQNGLPKTDEEADREPPFDGR